MNPRDSSHPEARKNLQIDSPSPFYNIPTILSISLPRKTNRGRRQIRRNNRQSRERQNRSPWMIQRHENTNNVGRRIRTGPNKLRRI